MTRTPPRPGSDVRTPSQLRRELVKLHVWAGAPGARRLTTTAAGLGQTLARSTTHDLTSGVRANGLPSRDFVRAFVMACLTHAGVADVAAEAESWDQAWLAVVQAHGQIPATPGTTADRPANTSRHRVIFLAAAAVIMLAGTVFFITSSNDASEAVSTTTEIQDIYCAADGLTARWRNHHSQLYLAVPDTTFTVTSHPSATVDGCAHRLTAGELCLEASDTATLVDCADRPQQLWVIENHWYNEGVMWQRLHPAHRLDLCLQQQTNGDSASSQAALKPCGTNWIQQWQLQPTGQTS